MCFWTTCLDVLLGGGFLRIFLSAAMPAWFAIFRSYDMAFEWELSNKFTGSGLWLAFGYGFNQIFIVALLSQ